MMELLVQERISALLVTEIMGTPCFRAHVSLTCYRNHGDIRFSSTCWPYLLPKLSILPVFGHISALLVTEIIDPPGFRAHIGLTCYRNHGDSRFSGTCTPHLLPKLSILPVFEHMLVLLVTEIMETSGFRAQVGLTCYRNYRSSRFSGTCSPHLLPKSWGLPVFGYMFSSLGLSPYNCVNRK
jgi:hypothetical protein